MERQGYRIIDANFNRAREAVRVVEEYCRFVLDEPALTKRAKNLRHQLSAVISQFDRAELLAARDTAGDVGIGASVPDQLKRQDLADACTAAAARLSEALRVLAEVIQPIQPEAARALENLRYNTYSLEKDIVVLSVPPEKFKKTRLYVLISRQLPADVLSLTAKCISGGADCIQLRAGNISDRGLFELAHQFVELCAESSVLSIINDRVDIAIASGADGVHLGQHDIPLSRAKSLQKKPLIFGISTHNITQLEAAIELRPAYIALGPAFATTTKPQEKTAGPEYIEKGAELLRQASIPSVAIGGINQNNVADIVKLGPDCIAVGSAVIDSADPAGQCRRLKELILSDFA